jgi:chromate reductase, NAD(P)H dehydrogenase (quinone)
MHILGISGSLRKASTNTGILKYMALHGPDFSIQMELADLTDVPFLNTDTEQQKPAAVQKLLAQMEAADAFVFASPEYNYSLAPALKNALDWGSRAKGNALFQGKAAAIVSSAASFAKGARSQHHLRQVGVYLDLHFINKPEIMCSAFDGTFDNSNGELVNEESQKKVLEQLVALKGLCLKLRS